MPYKISVQPCSRMVSILTPEIAESGLQGEDPNMLSYPAAGSYGVQHRVIWNFSA